MTENLGFLSGLATFLALGGLGIALLQLTRNHRGQLRFQVALFLGAFLLRYGLSLALYQGGLIELIKDEDGSGWLVGVAYLQEWQREGIGWLEIPGALLNAYRVQNRGYYFLLATLFSVTGPARLPAAALNCWFGALTAVYTFRTARTLFSDFVANRVGAWLAVFPSMVIWSAQTVKEPVVILLEVLAVYGCVHFNRSAFSCRHLLLAIGCIALLVPFRFYAAYLATAAVIGALVFSGLGQRRLGPQFGRLLGLLVVAAALLLSGVLAGREAAFEKFDLKYVQLFRKFAAQGGSGVDYEYDMSAPGGLGASVAIGAAHLLLAPFPWQLAGGSARMMLVGPEMLYWWWLVFIGVVPGMAFAIRRRLRDVLPLLLMLAGLGMLYSLMFGNVGLVYRQRAQLLPWLLIFAAAGLEQRWLRRRGRGHAVAAPGPTPPVPGPFPVRPLPALPGPSGQRDSVGRT